MLFLLLTLHPMLPMLPLLILCVAGYVRTIDCYRFSVVHAVNIKLVIRIGAQV